jgi:hypothetical protein
MDRLTLEEGFLLRCCMCSSIDTDRRFRGAYWQNQQDWNVSHDLPRYTYQHPSRQPSVLVTVRTWNLTKSSLADVNILGSNAVWIYRWTNISEKRTAALKMEAVYFSEALVSALMSIRRYSPKHQCRQLHHYENLTSGKFASGCITTCSFDLKPARWNLPFPLVGPFGCQTQSHLACQRVKSDLNTHMGTSFPSIVSTVCILCDDVSGPGASNTYIITLLNKLSWISMTAPRNKHAHFD